MSEHDMFESVGLARDQLTALRARLESDGAGRGSPEIVKALRDLHEMLDQLRSRYGLMREILDRTSDAAFAKDREGRYTMINPRGADMFGKTMSGVLGADDRNLFGRADADRIMAVDREVMSTGAPHSGEATFEVRGIPTTLLTSTTAWYGEGRSVRGVIGIAQDVTERRQSERDSATHHDRMRSMAAEIVISEERLRRSLASELHTGLGQDIALAKMKLSMLRNSAGADLHVPLKGIEELVERADRSLRTITFQISPPSLHDLGLVAAIQWLGEDVGRKFRIDVRVVDADSPAVADERSRVILFRAVRELLINAATHGRVRAVEVRITGLDDRVRIVVEDSGVGFDPSDLDLQGYGLFGIREQLKYVDGSMDVRSAPGRGATVTITAPCSRELDSTRAGS